MTESHIWRELLAEIIKSPQEKQRIAAALGVNPLTLMRWSRNESTPHGAHVQRLHEVLPKLSPLLVEEFGAPSSLPTAARPSAIPTTLYNHVLGLYATVPDQLRFWSICTAVLQKAVQHLASDGVELDISVVRCLSPYQGTIVRCLRQYVGLGTSLGKERIEVRARLFGAESLAGYVVESGHPEVIADISQEQRLPHQLSEQARSAAASPILYAGRVAGCLLLVSTEPDYFGSPVLLDLINAYTPLLALAFDAEEFYESHSIKLGIMPSLQVQDSYLATFQQRLTSMLKKGIADQHPLTYLQAEQRTWGQIAEELLGLSPRLSLET